MRLANVRLHGKTRLAVQAEGRWHVVHGVTCLDELLLAPAAEWTVDPEPLEESAIQFLPVVLRPEKILCVGRNYLAHVQEVGVEVPKAPCFFAKFSSSLAGDGWTISPPRRALQLDYEGELAVVIGVGGRNIPRHEALHHVFGYTAANDFTARDLQKITPQWLQGKAPDGFLPIGPYVVTSDEIPDPQNLLLRTRLNGEVVQESRTDRMIFSVADLISYGSELFTLRPGDLIITGTPEGVQLGRQEPRWLRAGDFVEVELEGWMTLRSTIGEAS